NQVEALITKEGFQSDAVADVYVVMGEMLGAATQTIQIPRGITRLAKKNLAHVVVDTMNFPPSAVKMLDRFGTDQAAGTRD
ncbi:MAG TPA: hypothetical protein VMU53_20230, partial [Candidatus Sulfotelmatobacter sp.]|nr:hypothetical protein [Candidatus Sulfotelmatobacter sp.]